MVAPTLNIHGKLMSLGTPRVMGILNVTPDSFYAASRYTTEEAIITRVQQILDEGGDIVDVGGYSTRPGAVSVSSHQEKERLENALRIISKHFPQAVLSVDTYRADIAAKAVEKYGVAIINDISAGEADDAMLPTVARLQCPYIAMHRQGSIETMMQHTHYDDVVREVLFYFSQKSYQLREMGINDLIIDPGFGFSKEVADNYRLMHHLSQFAQLELPILIGVSRKSMIYKPLGSTPEQSLAGTSALHSWALTHGAHLLRVHDVKAAVEIVKITQLINLTP